MVLLQLGSVTTAQAAPGGNEISQIADLTASLDQRFAAGSISTTEIADAALKESTAAQTRLQNWFEQSERHCYDRFFVNDCLSDVKQQRRQHNLILQRISLEAKATQRRLHIEQIDRELAEKQAKP